MLAVCDGSEVEGAISTKQPFAAAVAIRQEIAPTCDGEGVGGIDGEHKKVQQKNIKGSLFSQGDGEKKHAFSCQAAKMIWRVACCQCVLLSF